MIDIYLHSSLEFSDEAREKICFDFCRLIGQIPEMYPFLQAHATPNGDIRLIIGEGMASEKMELEGFIMKGSIGPI